MRENHILEAAGMPTMQELVKNRTPIVDELFNALGRQTALESELARRGQQVKDIVDTTNRAITKNGVINSLGELQHTGRDFDRICTELSAAQDKTATLIRLYKATNGTA